MGGNISNFAVGITHDGRVDAETGMPTEGHVRLLPEPRPTELTEEEKLDAFGLRAILASHVSAQEGRV